MCSVCINKPSHTCIIIPTLEIIQLNLFIVVVTTVSEGVNGCNIHVLGELGVGYRTCHSTPSIVGISCNCLSIFVNDCDYITLKILDEVVGNRVVKNATDRIFIVIQRNECIATPRLAENLCSIKRVSVENTVYLFARSDAVDIVGLPLVSVSS